MGYFLILLTVLLAVTIKFFSSKKVVSLPVNPKYHFTISAKGPIVKKYVDGMETQHIFNSRVLNGSGKMHFVDEIIMGSAEIKEKSISVARNLGDRFL